MNCTFNCKNCKYLIREIAPFGETQQYGILNKCEKYECIVVDFKPCPYFKVRDSETEIEAKFSTFMSEQNWFY